MITITAARDDDSSRVIELIAGVFLEYPGCVLAVEQEEPELLRVATSFAAKGGEFWVARAEQSDAKIVGSVGWRPVGPATAELVKLYVAAYVRRQGLARRLVGQVADAASRAGCGRLECWSDSRFREAHALYEALGFQRTGSTRDLHDLSNTTEYHFSVELGTGQLKLPSLEP